MKWFQHETDARNNPKIKQLVKEFGPVGYYICFTTFEIIGDYGDKYLRLSLEKYPKSDIADDLRIKEDILDKVWAFMLKKNLLSPKFFKRNILYSVKLKERADEYTKKLRSKSGQYRDKVGLQDNTIQDNTIQESIYPFSSRFMFVKKDFFESLKTTYNYINLEIEFKKMEGWLLANPTKRQRYRNWQRFIVNWLNRIEKPIEPPKPKEVKPISLQKPDPKEQEKVGKLVHKTVEEMK